MARELPKVYEPQNVEARIYDMWQQGGFFHAERDESEKPFTIVMPPSQRYRPAAYGSRHGCDHAGYADSLQADAGL